MHLKGIATRKRAIKAFGRKPTAATAMISLSSYSAVPARPGSLTSCIIGERTFNTNGSKIQRRHARRRHRHAWPRWGSRSRSKKAPTSIDVCVDYVGRDGVPDRDTVIQRFVKDITAALMIDSTQLDVVEARRPQTFPRQVHRQLRLIWKMASEKLAKMVYLLKRLWQPPSLPGTIDEDKTEAMGKTRGP